MSTAADHFTSFVEALADVLDDHDATGEVLAQRLYVSRFHLDRIISSVAGEPPARFRRRILLERAAYRLVTTQLSILDVAVEAGYGRTRRSPGRSCGPTESVRSAGAAVRRRSGSRHPATSTSIHPAVSGCRHRER